MKNRHGIDEVPEILADLGDPGPGTHESAAERQRVIEEAEAYLSNGRDEAHGFKIRGDGLTWGATAHGERGPTQFDSRAFGSVPLRGPLLWQHDNARPIGTYTATPTASTLEVDADIADTQLGRDAVALIKAGAVNAFSVGFTALRSHPGPRSVARVVDEATLHEMSLVTFPADSTARIQSIDGQAVPQFHAAPPVEVERSAPVRSRGVMDIVAEAERDRDAILYGASTTPPRVEEEVGDESEENSAFAPRPQDDGSLRSWMRDDARALMRSYERAGLTPAAAAERNRTNFSRGAW